jgi:curved DNA-binding protein CbpA
MLNPYELLGVTIDTPKDDIKKIYFQLSLLAHPDKGGNTDDMITLKKAYDFVMREIKNINTSVTVEDLEATFKDFCKTQENNVPLFQDIYAEAFNVEKFNDYFNRHNNESQSSVDKANGCVSSSAKLESSGNFLSGGYGDMMDSNNNFEYKTEYNPNDIGQVTHQFTTTITEYKAPKETQVFQHLMDYTNKGPIDDYSLDVGGLHMSDYKAAYTIDINNPKTLDKIDTRKIEPVSDKSLEELLKERENLYIQPMVKEENLQKKLIKENDNGENKPVVEKINRSEYIWSYEGLIDSARNVVKDFFRIQ